LVLGSAHGAAPYQIAAVPNAMARHYCADKGRQYGVLLAQAFVSTADLQDRSLLSNHQKAELLLRFDFQINVSEIRDHA